MSQITRSECAERIAYLQSRKARLIGTHIAIFQERADQAALEILQDLQTIAETFDVRPQERELLLSAQKNALRIIKLCGVRALPTARRS